MAKRGAAGRYYTFGRAPAVGSRFEFLTAGFEILDRDPCIPLGGAPIPIKPTMPDWLKRQLEYENANAEVVNDRMRDTAIARLRDLGVADERLSDPNDTAVSTALADFVRLQRQAIANLHEASRGLPALSAAPAHARVLAAAALHCCGDEKAAVWLNDGGGRLTRHHVRRGGRAFLNWLHRMRPGQTSLHKLVLLECVSWLRALELVRTEAMRRPEYRSLRGAALAHEIDERAVLAAAWARAHDILDARGQIPDTSDLMAEALSALRDWIRAA